LAYALASTSYISSHQSNADVKILLNLQEARKLLHNVPVVTKDWVEACMQRNKQVRLGCSTPTTISSSRQEHSPYWKVLIVLAVSCASTPANSTMYDSTVFIKHSSSSFLQASYCNVCAASQL
jgi:hypothetical protein